jgi:hypothetical protein
MAIAPPLSVGWGYGIVLGIGAIFAFGMVSFITPHFNPKYITNWLTDPRYLGA